jgi:hypothetical protein
MANSDQDPDLDPYGPALIWLPGSETATLFSYR